jgi:hypothetical protein
MKPKLTLWIAVLALAALACNSFVALPGTALETGTVQTFSIDEAALAGISATQAELVMAPGKASLNLAGGADGLAQGQVEYNVGEWQPALTSAGGVLRIEQSLPEGSIASVPSGAVNRWDVALGDGLADVRIECPAGAYTLTLDESLPDGARIAIQAGAVALRLVVPAEAAASVAVQRGPTGLETEGDWVVSDNFYTTGGAGPAWNIQLTTGVGSLTLVAE